jgi:histidinol phosphatase-like PHP family hydrolase
VVRLAKEAGARMIVDTDTHSPEDLIDTERAIQIAIGAGLTPEEARRIVTEHPIVRDS